MRKNVMVIILTMFMFGGLFANANANTTKQLPITENKNIEVSDSSRFLIDYDKNEIFLNFGEYNKETFKYKLILNGGFDDFIFQQMNIYGKDKQIELCVMMGRNGDVWITTKNVKNNKKTSYKLV